MMSPLSIVFAGTPEFGIPCLNALYSSPHRLLAVYSQPDRPAGRGRKLQSSPVKEWAMAHDIPTYQPINFKQPEAIEQLSALQADIMVVIAYGLLLPAKVLAIPRFGCINVHASLLPRWRGASPIQQAILQGDQQSGVTIMQMDVGLDTGACLQEVICPIMENDTAGTLHDKLALLSAKPLLETLENIRQGSTNPKPQNNELARYAGKICKEDARINWHEPAVVIDRKIRAFHPWPIAFSELGETTMRIHQASIEVSECVEPPGTILAIERTGIVIAAGEGVIRIVKIQFPGGRVVSVADWFNASKTSLVVGSVLQ